MPQNLAIEPPNNEEEFERWCLWLARAKYGPDVFLYSRKKQYGIDIYWLRHGKYVVIQCKQRAKPDPAELIRSLEKDFATAQKYFGTDLEQFIFASTISLEQASQKVTRANSSSESLLDAAIRLGLAHNVTTVCWHWQGMSQYISDSPWLMAHLLGLEKGGELISKEFFAEQHKKHGHDTDLKQAFYGGKKAVQWCGIVQQLDAPRLAYETVKQAITNSFANDNAVAALIKGDGGSGKSVLLRRLAHDLCTEYSVYWLETGILSFLDCEWVYDVLKQNHAEMPPKYLIFLEDWYQHVENSSQQKETAELLAKISKTSYVRLVIGDRLAKPGGKKAYEIHVPELSVFELNASENLGLLETIFTQMPEWRAKATPEQIEKAANASLFQLLFIFQYAEDMSGTIADIYQRIFASDCRALLERSTDFWKGMAKALYFYANLYASEGVLVTLEFLRDLAAYFGDGAIPMRYSAGIGDLANDKLLKKYFGLKTVNRKNTDVVNYFCFHHDTMADNGWMLLGDLVGEQYDETLLQAMLKSFQDKYSWIVGSIYYRQSRLSGEKGMEAARAYLNLSHPESNQNAFESCLKKLRNEPLAQKKAQDFLETKEPWGFKTAFHACLNLFKTKEFAKDLIQKRAQDFLNTEKPWEIQEAFTFCLNLLKTEVLAKGKARDFLKTEKPWENHTEFNVCLELFKNEDFAKEKARDFLETEKPWGIQEAFTVCLDLLKTEDLAKNKAQDFLKTEKPWGIQEAFTVCLDLLKTEDLAKNKAQDFLKTEKPWAIAQAFIACLNFLKNEVLAEDKALAKNKAREFLDTEKPWGNHQAFNACLDLLKDEKAGIDKAVFILENRHEFNAGRHVVLLYRSLDVLHDKPEHQQLVTLVANEIISGDYSVGNIYLQILKIPLFYVPQWVQSTEHGIRNWSKLNRNNPRKPWIDRNALYSITIGYREKPELIKAMCLGLIRNWRFELRINQKHQAYFIRCLAHPAIQRDEKLRQKMIAICKDILHCNTQPPLIINDETRKWLVNIIQKSQFPEWNCAESG